ncbi:cytochrome P450 [Butyriboletus roseoflavus]|nr:cytochrome P450 [Butyriboletus roseoflavus]
MQQARHRLIRVGLKLIDERKSIINIEEAQLRWDDKPDYLLSPVEPDLLSVLEVLCQISTFLAAGYETSSSALTWCLYALATAPQCQNRLRDAIRTITSNSPTLDDDIFKLEYLD